MMWLRDRMLASMHEALSSISSTSETTNPQNTVRPPKAADCLRLLCKVGWERYHSTTQSNSPGCLEGNQKQSIMAELQVISRFSKSVIVYINLLYYFQKS